MKRVYLDSNVFIALMKTEIGRGFRGLFAEAQDFLERAKEQDCTLVLSGLFSKEVKRFCYLNEEEILCYFAERKIKTELAGNAQKPLVEEFVEKGVHFWDASHAAIAVANHCDCIVTFNVKDFVAAKSKIMVIDPAEFK